MLLHRYRSVGRCRNRVLAVGSAEDVEHLVQQAKRARYDAFEIVAACVPGGRYGLAALGCPVPVVGRPDAAADLAAAVGADTIAVTNDEVLGRDGLRRLAWRLQESELQLLLAPALTDVAGPRVSVRPLAGLPLLHVGAPSFSGTRHVVKTTFDRLLAGLAVTVLLPVVLVIALAIKLDSSGPVLYRQERVGLRGQRFACLKFRSMVQDAEARLASLRQADQGNGMLFKMRNDPRVTRVGRFLRRYSLDELPQLLNVLEGSMSLVGPRPPLQSEVDRYESDVRRRLLVKPGITGLWQVSGRSDLPWEESVRLDLYYVENWSPLLDLTIMARTVSAVVRARGAY
jgi:exopolysaccharide biosynthesis polyprenyl glycosylphosphotransferase